MAFFTNANISADLVSGIDKSYADVVLRKHAILGLSEHIKGGGASVTVPVRTGYTVSEGTAMSSTTSSSGSTARSAFIVTPSVLYRTAQVNIAQAMWSEDPNLAAVDILMDEAKATMQGIGDSVERALFGTGYGNIGTISSHSGSTPNFTAILTKPSDAYRFAVGDVLASKATFAAASLDSGTCTVASVDYITGTLTLTGDGTWAPVDTHVLGKSNVIAASASPILWPGLAGWNPDIDNRPASNDSFFNVNRYVNPQALAGTAIDCTGQAPKQAINTLLQAMSNVDGINVDTVLMQSTDYGKLLDDLGSAVEFIDVTGEMGMNYGAVRFEGPTGPLNVISATFATAGIIRAVDSSVLKIKYPGKKPVELKDENGAGFIAVTTDDIAQFTMRANFIFWPSNPAALGNVKIY